MNLQNGLENVHGCNEWNSFYEEKIAKESNSLIKSDQKRSTKPKNLTEVEGKDAVRIETGFR